MMMVMPTLCDNDEDKCQDDDDAPSQSADKFIASIKVEYQRKESRFALPWYQIPYQCDDLYLPDNFLTGQVG